VGEEVGKKNTIQKTRAVRYDESGPACSPDSSEADGPEEDHRGHCASAPSGRKKQPGELVIAAAAWLVCWAPWPSCLAGTVPDRLWPCAALAVRRPVAPAATLGCGGRTIGLSAVGPVAAQRTFAALELRFLTVSMDRSFVTFGVPTLLSAGRGVDTFRRCAEFVGWHGAGTGYLFDLRLCGRTWRTRDGVHRAGKPVTAAYSVPGFALRASFVF